MDYASTATGSEDGKPLLLMPDQDHPDTMNQIVWSLMNILESQSIAGVPFDKTNETSYNRVRIAIQKMIATEASAKATLPEVRTGTNDTKFVTPLGATAASGNYSQYISVATTPAAIANTAMGGLIIASGSASAITLPALSGVARVGAAYHFLNLSSNTVSISRVGGDTILGAVDSSVLVTLKPGQRITLTKIAAAQWAAIDAMTNDRLSVDTTPVGMICAFGMPTPPSGWYECDGSLKSRTTDATLFGVIGEWWGAGDGATTFKIPDFRGESLIGWDHGRGVDTGRAFASWKGGQVGYHAHTDANFSSSAFDTGSALSFTYNALNNSYSATTRDLTAGRENMVRGNAALICIKYR